MIISFEGIEGVGKSTQINLLKDWLNNKGLSTVLYREPGSTETSEKIRELLLSNDLNLSDESELLLMFAARAQLVSEKINNNEDDVILFDRYYDASIAYQGHGRSLSLDLIKNLIQFTNCPEPNLTILLDLDIEEGFKRKSGDVIDRIESSGIEFFNRVREGYKQIAKSQSHRVKLINANQDSSAIHNQIIDFVNQIL